MQKAVIKKKNDSKERAEGAWEELYRLGEEIGSNWASPQISAEILSEMRR